MPRPKSTPTYCVDKGSGRAYVTIDGRKVPLGLANTTESRDAYDRIIGQWFSNGRRLPPCLVTSGAPQAVGPSVTVVIDAFWTHAQTYYAKPATDEAGNSILNPDGTPKRVATEQLDAYRQVLRLLKRMYASTPAAVFATAEALQNYAGTSPVTRQSGRSRVVVLRRACNKTLRATVHLWADLSR
jgi:hypothetical protein